MPELPEVEILARHLAPLLKRRRVHGVRVLKPRIIRPHSGRLLDKALRGAKFINVVRRGKYLLFELQPSRAGNATMLVGHLGMTGRFYLLPAGLGPPKHAVVIFHLGGEQLIFEDARQFGRLMLDTASLDSLGPEPFSSEFTADYLSQQLKRSAQAIKVRLLDQALVAGVGNIYASEALHRAGISPRIAARLLKRDQVLRLRRAIRDVLQDAIKCGSAIPLDFSGADSRDGLFYYGSQGVGTANYEERLRVYDRAGEPCLRCGNAIERLVQASRSTFYCPVCQSG